MSGESTTKNFQDRVTSISTDTDFKILEKRYQPYLELHGIGGIFDVFEIKQVLLGEVVSAKVIWHMGYDLPIDLKREVIKVFHRHFRA